MDNTLIDIVVLVLLVLMALWAVMSPRLLRAVIALAAASILVTLLLFRLDSPLAAVFELSVCAGLISAVFLGAITLTQPDSEAQLAQSRKERIRRYWYLPPLLVLLGVALLQHALPTAASPATAGEDVRTVLWTSRHLDLLGQITVLLAGAFGVVVLFKEAKNHER
jgi:NADH-quinone oxidoreductase subunit J